jgi:hypothetical protein
MDQVLHFIERGLVKDGVINLDLDLLSDVKSLSMYFMAQHSMKGTARYILIDRQQTNGKLPIIVLS